MSRPAPVSSPRHPNPRRWTRDSARSYFSGSRPLAWPLIKIAKFLTINEERIQMFFGKIVNANRPQLGSDLGTPQCRWILCPEPFDSRIQAVVQGPARRNSLVRQRLAHLLLPFFIIRDSTAHRSR